MNWQILGNWLYTKNKYKIFDRLFPKWKKYWFIVIIHGIRIKKKITLIEVSFAVVNLCHLKVSFFKRKRFDSFIFKRIDFLITIQIK